LEGAITKCPRCGSNVQPGTRFCPICGYDLAALPSEQKPPATGWQSSEGAKQRLIEIIQRRSSTDEVIPTIWILFPILAVILAVVVGTVALFFNLVSGLVVFIAGTILAVVLIAILNYKLLKRQDGHMAREAALRRALIDYFRARGEERGVGYNVFQYTQAMEGIDRDALFREKRRDPLLWTLVVFIPIVGWILYAYMLYFLTDFNSNHDKRWSFFVQNAQLAGNQMGLVFVPPTWRTVPERSFVLYLVITILLSIFLVWWYYVLIKDLNDHFYNEWEFEDQLLRELQKG
jgi:hypothetical protein